MDFVSVPIAAPKQPWFNHTELAKYLEIDSKTLTAWVRDGMFPKPVKRGAGKAWSNVTIGIWTAWTALANQDEQTESVGRLVYFILAGERVKIGSASEPTRRLKELQTGSSQKLEILHTCDGGFDEEARLHKLFAAYRTGGEWFEFNDEINAYIEELKAKKDS